MRDRYSSSNGYPYRNFKRMDEFRIIKELGKGGYSIVYLVEHNKTGEKYALKCAFKLKKGKDRSHRTRTEIEVLDYLEHPNIVKIKGWFEDDETIYLVLEHLRGKDLVHFFKKDLPSNKDAIKVVKQIIDAISYCHSKGIIHRDIKMDNILIDKTLTIKITDFGLCAVNESDNDVYYSEVGTVRYTAPEILSGKGYNKSIDIWSFGIVLFMLLTRKYPFDGSNKQKVFKRILDKEIDYNKYPVNSQAKHLLKHILVKDPDYRYNLDEIMKHPWLNE